VVTVGSETARSS